MRVRVSTLGTASIAAGALVLVVGASCVSSALTAAPARDERSGVTAAALPAMTVAHDEEPQRALGFETPPPAPAPSPEPSTPPRVAPWRDAPVPVQPVLPAEQPAAAQAPAAPSSPDPTPPPTATPTPTPTPTTPPADDSAVDLLTPAPPMLGSTPEADDPPLD